MGLRIASSEPVAWRQPFLWPLLFPRPSWNNNLSACVQSDFSPALCDPIACSPPGSCICGILQARILQWAAMPSSRGSARPRTEPEALCLLHWQAVFLLFFLNHWSQLGSPIFNSNINLTTYWLCNLSLNYLPDTKSVFVSIKWRYRTVHSCQILKVLWICRSVLLLNGSLYLPMYLLIHKLMWVLRAFRGISTKIL